MLDVDELARSARAPCRRPAAHQPARSAATTAPSIDDLDEFQPEPAIALHHQIKEDLFLHLRSGHWPPGFELPTEEALCRHYGVSRGTMRRAIADLVTEGYIERHRGRGSFVSRPKLESGVQGSYSRFRVIGPPLDAGGRVLACRRVRGAKDVAAMLGLEAGRSLWRLERVRFTDSRPVSLQTSFIPVELCPDLPAHEKVAEYRRALLRGDIYRYRIELR